MIPIHGFKVLPSQQGTPGSWVSPWPSEIPKFEREEAQNRGETRGKLNIRPAESGAVLSMVSCRGTEAEVIKEHSRDAQSKSGSQREE